MSRSSPPDDEIKTRYREMMRRVFSAADDKAIELFGNLMKIQHMISGIMERHMSQYDLSRAKFGILMWLNALDQDGTNSGLLPSELSKMRGVMPNTVSSLLNSLREQGLIEQIRHPQDRRKRIIRITQAGRDLIRQVGPVYHDFIKDLFCGMSDSDKQELNTLLNKASVSIEDAMQKIEGSAPESLVASEQDNSEHGEDDDGDHDERDQEHCQGVGTGRSRRVGRGRSRLPRS